MSIKHRASVIALVAAVSSTAQTGTPPPAPSVPELKAPQLIRAPIFGEPAESGSRVKKAYEVLFQARRRSTDVTPKPAPPQPSIVCGLTIWNVDPDLDPRIRLRPPQPPNVTYTIQKITPPVCQP